MFGDIKVKSRPLRLAFLLPPERAPLLKAIQATSSLWGGTFNPLIPIYARAPKAWKEYPRQRISAQSRVLGYIRAFDPDFLVNCTTDELPSYVRDLRRPTISIDHIWPELSLGATEGLPLYGVGIFEILSGVYREFFEVRRRFPSKVLLPTFPREHELFWAAVVGSLPPAIEKIILSDYAKAIDIERHAVTAKNFADLLTADKLLPRHLARYQLNTERAGWRGADAYAFFMDATRPSDIIDFGNLRALGRSVLAIPKQFTTVPEYISLIRRYIRDHYRVDRHNPTIDYGTTVIRSSASEMRQLEALAQQLELATVMPEKPQARLLSIQHWYPRIWDEWGMNRDGAVPDNVFSTEDEYSFPDSDGSVTFKLVRPAFVEDQFVAGPRYANEIYPKFYGQSETTLADVLPYDHGQEVLRAAGPLAVSDEFRIGRTGLVHLVQWRQTTHWVIPRAEEVFLAWLKDKGFDASLSPCGRLAKQVHSQLRGWIAVLANEKILQLFELMTAGGEDGRGAALGHVKNDLRSIDRSDGLYHSLVSRGVFQLGYRTQCSHCQRFSWHSLDNMATQLVCPLCHKKMDAISAVDSAHQGAWYLKTAGPFSVPNYGDGSYCVLLTLNVFERDHSLQTTPVMSFKGKHIASGTELEADFGLLWQETVFGETMDGVLFAECKSYNRFKREDFDRMRKLAKQFPGALIAFSTLRRNFDPSEIKELKRIANSGTKMWKSDRPINPVLLLTGNELFSQVGAPHCWDGIVIPDWAKRTHTLLDLCNATQAIYLGLPHWQETWRAAYETRRARRRAASESGTTPPI
jgi:hypothetical protein